MKSQANPLSVYDTDEKEKLIRIFESQRLTHFDAVLLASSIVHWKIHKGLEWVIQRLKALRAALLSDNLQGFRTKGGALTGPFASVHRLWRSGRRGRIRVDRILRVYGRWEAPQATQTEWRKLALSLHSVEPDHKVTIQVPSDMARIAKIASRSSSFDRGLFTSGSKTVPHSREVLGVTATEADLALHDHLAILIEKAPGLMARFGYLISEACYGPGGPDSIEPFLIGLYDEGRDVVGTIACLTSDGGYKRRFIANPNRALQRALSRLKNACQRVLHQMPESCVYDQGASLPWIQGEIQKGKLVWSFDLSSATDYFPLSLQVSLLKRLFPELDEDIDLWEAVSCSSWDSPVGPLSYSVGQPMGTGPSFSAFSLSHLALVRGCGGHEGNFRILGDDIVITDEAVAKAYAETIKVLGVQISLSKSLMGKSIAEFAGRIVDGEGPWPSFKGRKTDISQDPFGFIRQYGLAGASLIPSAIRKKISRVAVIPFIGPPHVADTSVFEQESYKDVDWSDLYSQGIAPLGLGGTRKNHLAFCRPDTTLTLALREFLGPEGDLVVASLCDRRLREHINANLRDNCLTETLSDWRKSIPPGALQGPDALVRAAYESWPISYVNKIAAQIG